MSFKNKVVWITGASSGIGEALVYALNERGAKLIISSRRRAVLEDVRARCGSASEVHILPLDLSEPEAMCKKTKQALAIYGHVDFLFNNGGLSQRSLALKTDLSVVRAVMEVNFFGTVALTKALVPAMIDRGCGQVIVTSSLMGKFGTRMRSTYAASKHALHGWFDSLRQELDQEYIKVTLVCPGFVKTNVTINALQGDGSALGKMSPGQKKAMSPKKFAEEMLDGVQSGKEELYIGGKEVWAVYLKRLAPRLLNKVLRRSKVT